MRRKQKKRQPGMKGISRIDQPEKRNHGWFIRLTRRGERFSAFCSDRKHGGKTKALLKAKRVYAKMLKEHPPMSRLEFSQIVRRPNKTGILGVTKVTKHVAGRKYVFWQATWSPKQGEIAKKAFSVGKHGNTQAQKLAIKARKTGLAKLRHSASGK